MSNSHVPDLSQSTLPEVVLLFSTADWDAPYWTNKQHTAQALAARGVRVLYLESPGLRRPRISGTDLRRLFRRLRHAITPLSQKSRTLWVCSTISIPMGHRFALVRWLNGAIIRRNLRRWLRAQGGGARPLVWTFHPYIDEALRGLDPCDVLYHCVDDLSEIPGIDAEAFALQEVKLLARADVTFATSPKLQKHCAAKARGPVFFERNVADLNHFARARATQPEPAELEGLPRPRLGYVGVLSAYKLDLRFILSCARARPDQHWVFIGEEPEGFAAPEIAALRALPNAHFLGYRPYDALPRYLAALDIATLPVQSEGYMASVFPMKFYEYLAAGRPILSRSLGAIEDVGVLIHQADTPEAWAQAVDRIMAAPHKPLPLEDPQLQRNSWEARLDRMLAGLAKAQIP